MKPNPARLALVARFLEGQSIMALATTGPGGSPSVAPLFYLPGDALSLYWFSSSSSRHSRNLKENPEAAVSVYDSTWEWKEIRGVQMRGAASAVTDRQCRLLAAEAYTERFRLRGLFEAAISRSTLYCFVPAWVRYIDNSRRFGYKFEISVGCASELTARGKPT